MDIIHNKYHIVRYGDFATNGNAKFFYGLFATMLCIDDYQRQNSIDCAVIALGSSIIWTIVEIYLHTSKTRIIKPMWLGLKNIPNMSITLPPIMGATLQGIQEGGVVTALGLYYGDRLYQPNIIIRLHIFITVVIFNVCMRNKPEHTKSSKRQINTTGSMLFIGSATLFDLIMLWKHPEHAYRQLNMALVMIYICAWWTLVAWFRGFRSVEVHVKKQLIKNEDKDTHYIKPVTMLDTAMILGYDVLFEVAAAYLIFYNIFLI